MSTQEKQYLNLLQDVLLNGVKKPNRTGVDTLSVFGRTMSFDIFEEFILLTTKKISLRHIFEELIFFLSGKTNSKALEDKKVNIWKGNTSREFLDKKGLSSLSEGELGCSYSHQWRNYGGEHPELEETRGLRGVDQIANIIKTLKEDPLSRRIYLIGSNPQQDHLAALPPCHNYAQFYINPETGGLSCGLVMRSNDLFLGNPYNLAQYNLLTIFLAKIIGTFPEKLFYCGMDVHLYENHVIPAKTQLQRAPRPLPNLSITKPITSLEDVISLSYSDIKLNDYDPHPRIVARMAV